MPHIVLDSSVLAKWILPEPDSPDALRLLRTTHANGDRCLCLALADAMGLIGVTADVPLCKAVQGDFPKIVLLRDWAATNP